MLGTHNGGSRGVDVFDLLLSAKFKGERALAVARVRIVHGQVPDEIPLVRELAVALAAYVSLFFRRLRLVLGIVVQVLVPPQQLLLSAGAAAF